MILIDVSHIIDEAIRSGIEQTNETEKHRTPLPRTEVFISIKSGCIADSVLASMKRNSECELYLYPGI